MVEANVNKLIIDAQTLRKFFNIEYSKNLGDIITQFMNKLSESIPSKISTSITKIEQSEMIKSLSKSNNEDPNKIYRNRVARNNGSRSVFKF